MISIAVPLLPYPYEMRFFLCRSSNIDLATLPGEKPTNRTWLMRFALSIVLSCFMVQRLDISGCSFFNGPTYCGLCVYVSIICVFSI